MDHPQFDKMGEETKSGMLPLHFSNKIQGISKELLNIMGMNLVSVQNFVANFAQEIT